MKTYLFLALFLITSFQTIFGSDQISAKKADDPSPIVHVVIVWLKEPGNQRQIEQIISASQHFTEIPGVTMVKAGRTLESQRPVVDTSYDVAILMTFENKQALREYDTHPLHRKAVEELIKPLVDRFIVYDFLSQ